MNYINKVINILVKISKAMMIALMTVMVISMFFQVVTRYVFGTGIPWTEELARFSNVWLIFIGASILTFSDEHIKVTLFDGILRKNSMIFLNAIRNIIYIVYSVAVIKVGFSSLVIVSTQTSPNMLLPMNYIYICIPVGAIISITYIIYNYIPKKKEENNG